jgi:hypothetical protein
MNPLSVVSGTVIASRLFEVADAIDLARAEEIWRRQARTAGTRGRLVSTPPKAMAFGVPPLEITLDPVAVRLGQSEANAAATARLYDFGVIRLALAVSADGRSWPEFTRCANLLEADVGVAAEAPVWRMLLEGLLGTFASALVRPARNMLEEDYLIGFVRAFDEAPDAEQLQQRIDLVPLLAGEARALSTGARRDLLRQSFSYYTDDLVVLTWDRAFVYEPRGESDVLDAIEVANAQLLELRYYDELLDAELPRMYGLVGRVQRFRAMLASRRYAALARRLYGLVAEVTELREKLDNALQVTEDVYLARIYAAALELFRVSAVSAAVDRKLAIIRDTYTALYEEASAGRAALMEFAVVLLIVVEIVLALWHH